MQENVHEYIKTREICEHFLLRTISNIWYLSIVSPTTPIRGRLGIVGATDHIRLLDLEILPLWWGI